MTKETLARLKASSAARVAENEELQELFQKLEEARERTAVVKVAELLEDEEPVEEEGTAGKTSEEITADADEDRTPQVQEALNVLADLVTLQGASG